MAINSAPVRNDKQALRMLSGTAGDLLVLVERDLNYFFEDEIDGKTQNQSNFNDENFIFINDKGSSNKRRLSASSVRSKNVEQNEDGYQNSKKNIFNNDEMFSHSYCGNILFCIVYLEKIKKNFKTILIFLDKLNTDDGGDSNNFGLVASSSLSDHRFMMEESFFDIKPTKISNKFLNTF